MFVEFPESEWKVFRKLREVALDRFCEKALAEMTRAASEAGKTSHERYLRVWKVMKRRDRELALAFDNPRRSHVLDQLLQIQRLNLLTADEMSQFSAETRNKTRVLLEL